MSRSVQDNESFRASDSRADEKGLLHRARCSLVVSRNIGLRAMAAGGLGV